MKFVPKPGIVMLSISLFIFLCFHNQIQAVLPYNASALPVIIEAESGIVGSDFTTLSQGDISFVRLTTDGEIFTPPLWDAPGSENRTITFEVTFPAPGTYNLFIRGKVGSGTWNDDSFFYPKGFGEMDYSNPADWIIANGLVTVGFNNPSHYVYGEGNAGAEHWKWYNISQNNYHQSGIPYTVGEDDLTQTFQIGGRESFFEIDKIAFGRADLYYTVSDLDSIRPGKTEMEVPEPQQALASGLDKWLGNIYSNSQLPGFESYWNQVTPENAGKWGSVAGSNSTSDPATWNWGTLDAAYNFAKDNGYPFRFHVLVWGNQQPTWMPGMANNPEAQLEIIENWFMALAERYPDIDFLEVVNEPLHDPPNADPSNAGAGNYIEALGGTGETGWDWVLNAFRMAREIFPPTVKLMINEYNILSNTSNTTRYRDLIQLLQHEDLIDAIGVQGHAFSTGGNASDIRNRLNMLAQTGLPIQVTEFDLDGQTDEEQLNDYSRIFPVIWEHPAVEGITLWGWRQGMWRSEQGAYLIDPTNGTERPALLWLKEYMSDYRKFYEENMHFNYPSDAYQKVRTYVNPVLPGNHPDLTLFKDGDDFYVSKSSFHFTPYLTIYHSTDLVHWQKLTRVIPSDWSGLINDAPQAGTWQGAITYFYGSYWIYFSNTAGGGQFFSKADNPAGSWSTPVRMNTTPDTGNSGYDNSVFVDDDGTPYLLIKPGRHTNRIQEIGSDGHLTAEVINLDWINADEQYSWAEGPVMTKRDGWYYYFIAGNVSGGQWSLRSRTLTADPDSWEELGPVFKDITDPQATFRGPNHMTEPFQLDDGTWWCLSHSYERLGNDDWSGLGRQGLLHQVLWDENGVPTATAPTTSPLVKPDLPKTGIPWKLPRSDYFDTETLGVHWHFLNRRTSEMYSLNTKPGWLTIDPGTRRGHLLQKDAGRYYSLVTRVNVDATQDGQQAGLYLTNGNESVYMKLYSGYNKGKKIVLEFENTIHEAENTIGDTLWLKIERKEHSMTAYYSQNGYNWTQLGNTISAVNIDKGQENFNWWVGNSQGLFSERVLAHFDSYFYRDGASENLLAGFNNHFGVQKSTIQGNTVFSNTSAKGGWIMIGGIELGIGERAPKTLEIIASSEQGGKLEIWADDLENEGVLISSINIGNTGGIENFEKFTANISNVDGQRDIYLRFNGPANVVNVKSIRFLPDGSLYSGVDIIESANVPSIFPNPFTQALTIDLKQGEGRYSIFDVTGKLVEHGIVSKIRSNVGEKLPPAFYFMTINTSDISITQKIIKTN